MVKKIRFIEPGNLPYRKSMENLYTYNKYIRNPSIGLLTLATIVKEVVDDTLMYSESISTVKWDDVLDADIVFIGIFTFSAVRGYEIAQYIKDHSNAIVVMGGLHASMNYSEAVNYCDYVLLGEGDESILDFIEAVQKERP
ncbi:MAG: B12-binding domain-containing radical SAM protein, partial [Bacillota bacterium]